MKIILATLLLALPVFGQDQAAEARAAAGCGPDPVQFDVKKDKNQHPMVKPESDKAVIYVIHEREPLTCIGPCPTYRIGLDGAWLGANRGDSFSFFSIAPGDHNLCINTHPRSVFAAALSFTAEAGKVYYFFVRFHYREDYSNRRINLEQVDNAKGSLLVSSTPFSRSQQKK